MANRLMPLLDKVLVRKRAVINDQLKNISQIEHSRHRSPINFLVNLLGGLIAYCWQSTQPSMSRETCLDLAFSSEFTLSKKFGVYNQRAQSS
jgi:hypothetical protein